MNKCVPVQDSNRRTIDNKGNVVTFANLNDSFELATRVIKIQQEWRATTIAHMNRNGGFSRILTHSSTDRPLLLDSLSQAAEIHH